MRRLILALLLLAVCASPALATEVYISDRGGSHVGSCEDNGLFAATGVSGANLGGSTEIFVGASAFAPFDVRIIQRYDIVLIPDEATIQSAEIVMEVTAIDGGGDTPSLYQIATANNDWVEGTAEIATQSGSSCWDDFAWDSITEWAGSPGLSTATTDYIDTKISSDQAISTTGTKTFVLNAAGIAALQGQLSDNDFEVIFQNLTTTIENTITFASSEHGTTAFRPYLKVTYTSESSILKIGECADCDSSIVPDTRLVEGSHQNGGGRATLNTGWVVSDEVRTIIKFPLNQGELTGATITAATFGGNVVAINNGGNTTIEIHEIAAANLGWIEGTKINTTAGAGEPDWFHFSHESPVTTWAGSAGLSTGGGTDYVDAVYGSFNGTSTGAKTATLSGAAITYLNDEIGNAAEFLLFTSDTFNAGEWTNIASSEGGTASERPYLQLTYTPAAEAPVVLQAIIIRR